MAISIDEQKAVAHSSERKIITSMCGICPGACGVNVELIDGEINRITPLKEHPVGTVCVRGAYSKDIVYSPDRLKYPLVRVGKKGEGRFERTSWDEAMAGIANKLQEIKATYGPQAVALHAGRGIFEGSINDVYSPPGLNISGLHTTLFPFGSPNCTGVGSLCYVSYGVLAAIPTLGTYMVNTYPDYPRAKLIVAWGANAATDSPPVAVKRIMSAKRKGARLIAIDHRRSDIAGKADQWIPIRPGTDGALALGMINVVIQERLYDAEFVENWTTGFAELSEYVKQFTPEAVERITRVPGDVVVETARAIATARHATLNMYTGLEYTNSGVQNIRAVFCLWAITGNVDVPGGIVLRPKKGPVRTNSIYPPSEPKPIGYDKYPLFCDLTMTAQFMEAPRAILNDDPYPLRAVLNVGGSILTAYPDPALWKECLAKLDLLVVMDRFMTGDVAYADYVLPATTLYENHAYQRYAGGFVQLRQRVIEPIGEARSNHFFYADLARRLGYGDLYPQSEEDVLQFAAETYSFDLQQLRDNPEGIRTDARPTEFKKYEKGQLRVDGKPGFDTPSGKLELASSVLAKYGYDPLPVYTEPSEGPIGDPELAKRYPLVLNTGSRIQSAFRTQHLNIPSLLKLQPEPLATINADDAASRRIKNGDRVYVETARGRVPYTARVTDGIIKGAVEINVGGGGPLQPQSWREAHANYLTDFENRDPVSGFPVFKALLCEVTKIEESQV